MTTSHTNTGNMVNATSKVTSAIIMVDAETASRWLTRNKRNRPISEATVKRYQADMEAGLWKFTGETVQFDTNGDMKNGQHRMTALSRTNGLTLPFLVVRGLDPDSQMFMDQGRKRTAGDQLSLSGVRYANMTASVVKNYIAWTSGFLFLDNAVMGTITAPVIQAWVEENQEAVTFLHDNYPNLKEIDAAPSVAGSFLVGAFMYDADSASAFITQLANLTGLQERDPVLVLSRRLRRIRRTKEKVSSRDLLAMFIQSFNAWLDGRSISKLQRPRGGAWTKETFPTVGVSA